MKGPKKVRLMVDRKKVRRQVLASFGHTFIAFLAMLIVMGIVVAITARFGGARVVIQLLIPIGGFAIGCFLFGEIVICMVFRAHRADPALYPNYVECVEESCRGKWMFKPRLYILNMKIPGHAEELPNAMAFGWGIFGQHAIGISDRLYQMLDREELKAVLAHEVGHIRCMDVGLMTVLTIVTGGAEKLGAIFKKGQTVLGKSPVAIVLAGFVWVVAKFIFPVGRAAIAQEREYSADALSALEMGTPDPLIRALKKLAAALPNKADDEIPGVFDDLYLSHPLMEKRYAALEALRV